MKDSDKIQKTALAVTRWVGSPESVVLHTLLFLGSFALAWTGYVEFEHMLLFLTTIVSLEAIYLSIFIQMTINYTTAAVEDISEDVEELQEDIGEIQEDVGEIQSDVGELQENVEDISEDVEEMSEDEADEEKRKQEQKNTLDVIQNDLHKLLADIERLKSGGTNASQ